MSEVNHKILSAAKELNSICSDLQLKEVKYFPSPKDKSPNYEDLALHATAMFKIYKRHIEGDSSAPIKEIFTTD